jgi:hypothetical protein
MFVRNVCIRPKEFTVSQPKKNIYSDCHILFHSFPLPLIVLFLFLLLLFILRLLLLDLSLSIFQFLLHVVLLSSYFSTLTLFLPFFPPLVSIVAG